MGRRKGKRGGANGTWVDRRHVAKIGTDNTGYTKFIVTNENFESYYARNLAEFFSSKDEWGVFLETIRQKLPVTFRVNPISQDNELLKKTFQETELIGKIIESSSEANNKQKKDKNRKNEEENKTKDTENQEANRPSDTQEKGLLGKSSNSITAKELEEETKEEIKKSSLKLKMIPWYPNQLVYQLNVTKYDLKGSSELASLHKYITKCCEAGLITRQELVSMLPPLFLNPKHDDLVFDSCAAPGSKTTQLVEMLRMDARNNGIEIPSGGIIANDAEFTRAYMLSHQIKRLCIPETLIVNHMAQFFPTIFTDAPKNTKRIFFDKILVDAPCSGDAAIRKIPELWTKWRNSNALALHKIQLKILLKNVHMLKEGGTLVYSTCSLNPIENEAVVTAAFKNLPEGSIELQEMHGLLPNLVSRRGLLKWVPAEEKEEETTEKMREEKENQEPSVPKRKLVFYESFNKEEIPANSGLESSMFPLDEATMRDVVKIQRTMRILPHDQNTGGFYIALIKKNKPTKVLKEFDLSGNSKKKEEETKIEEEEQGSGSPKILLGVDELEEAKPKGNQGKSSKGGYKVTKERADFIRFDSSPEWETIKEKYGIVAEFDSSLLYTLKGIEKKVILTTPKLAQLIESDKSRDTLFFINLGTKIFDNNRKRAADGIGYRLCQDGARYLLPFMTKRKILVSEKQMGSLMSLGNVRFDEIHDEEIKRQLEAMDVGSVVFYTVYPGHPERVKDCASFIRFRASVANMVGREMLSWFKLTAEVQKAK